MRAHAEPDWAALTPPGGPHLRDHDQRSAGTEGLVGRPAGHVGRDGSYGRLLAGCVLPAGRHPERHLGLVNAAHAKGLPGRKTDVSDSAWLAQLGECGLLKASFVPPEPVRHLRDLTRYRTALTVERSREAQRLEKELEDAGIKISAVATDILGVSGRAMLTALIEGEDDAQVMADMARGRMRTKIPALVQALTGSFGEHHSFLCRMHLTRIDELSATIEELSARIDQEMRSAGSRQPRNQPSLTSSHLHAQRVQMKHPKDSQREVGGGLACRPRNQVMTYVSSRESAKLHRLLVEESGSRDFAASSLDSVELAKPCQSGIVGVWKGRGCVVA